MDSFTTRSPNSEALWAELHRQDLLNEAAASRRARPESFADRATTGAIESGLLDRVRSLLGAAGRPAQPDCAECA